MKIAVGSKNPTKVGAAKRAFRKIFDKCEVRGILVSSSISHTPMDFEETVIGAERRAKKALKKLSADFGVGLEGGLEETKIGTFLSEFVAIVDKKERWGFAKGRGLLLPQRIEKKIKEGYELGDLIDKSAKKKNTKQQEGAVGFFTKNLITRSQNTENTIICALSRFIRSELFE